MKFAATALKMIENKEDLLFCLSKMKLSVFKIKVTRDKYFY